MMNTKELFEKIYNNEITDNDVIIEIDKDEKEYPRYILNDGLDYWYDEGDGIISLNFFNKSDNEYQIISKELFEKKMNNEARIKEIETLEQKLKLLKNSGEE